MLCGMTYTRRDMAYEYLDEAKILLSYHGSASTPEQWQGYLTLMHTLRAEPALRFVVVVDGSPPSASIRSRLAELVEGRQWPVALISASMALRFVVSVFTFVNRNIRYFTPAQTREALEYLQCTPAEASAVEVSLRRLTRD